jgi:hypothetical protein
VADHDIGHLTYEDADTSIADTGIWQLEDRDDQRFVFVLRPLRPPQVRLDPDRRNRRRPAPAPDPRPLRSAGSCKVAYRPRPAVMARSVVVAVPAVAIRHTPRAGDVG